MQLTQGTRLNWKSISRDKKSDIARSFFDRTNAPNPIYRIYHRYFFTIQKSQKRRIPNNATMEAHELRFKENSRSNERRRRTVARRTNSSHKSHPLSKSNLLRNSLAPRLEEFYPAGSSIIYLKGEVYRKSARHSGN